VRTLTVELGSRSYPIQIGEGLLASEQLLGELGRGRDVLLVSNTVVGPLYAATVTRALAAKRVVETIVPDGESQKTLGTVARLLDVLIANRFARDCLLVALGGGVVGDMTGFAAACYQRGVAYLQLPTTLLAQVDSSVGGKTAVNHPGGKNLIGAFHQPIAVLADTTALTTLPIRELRAGLAEVVKYGLICDAEFFDWLEANMDALLAADPAGLLHAVERSCEIKARIVSTDEREHGSRALLNLGHTFGHAVEAATGYESWLHGEAVGFGLLAAAAMSHNCGLLEASVVERIERLLTRMGLPTRLPEIGADIVLEHMRIDKKVQSGRMRLVLLRKPGDAFITADYAEAALQRTLSSYCG
jgi:3-dehydroquinate synthase